MPPLLRISGGFFVLSSQNHLHNEKIYGILFPKTTAYAESVRDPGCGVGADAFMKGTEYYE